MIIRVGSKYYLRGTRDRYEVTRVMDHSVWLTLGSVVTVQPLQSFDRVWSQYDIEGAAELLAKPVTRS